MNLRSCLTERMQTLLLAAAALVLLVPLAGCGGGGLSATAPPIDDTLFVPNYVSSLDGQLYHWNHLPMRVRFNLPSNWAQLYGTDQLLYIQAADEWNQEGRQTLVSVVPSGAEADAVVDFVNQSELGGNNVGLTEYTHDTLNTMRSATIRVALYDSRNRLVSTTDIRMTIAHELGHALGIGGHSPYSSDLMYPSLTSGVLKTTTTRDLNTVMTAYPGYFGRAVPETRAPLGPVTIQRDIIY